MGCVYPYYKQFCEFSRHSITFDHCITLSVVLFSVFCLVYHLGCFWVKWFHSNLQICMGLGPFIVHQWQLCNCFFSHVAGMYHLSPFHMSWLHLIDWLGQKQWHRCVEFFWVEDDQFFRDIRRGEWFRANFGVTLAGQTLGLGSC